MVRHAGRWHMLYSAISRAEDGAVQRVGLATSEDLVSWVREGLVLEADPRWYEVRRSGPRGPGWSDAWVHWRDPWVHPDPDGDGFHMLLCARAAEGPLDARGVIGHAVLARPAGVGGQAAAVGAG